MSSFHVPPPLASMTVVSVYNGAQVDLIWAMGLVSLESNNGELVLSQTMETCLTQLQIDDLKLRLSEHLGTPTVAVADHEARVFRIMRLPALITGDDPHLGNSTHSSSPSRLSSVKMQPSTLRKTKAHSRKAKIPRPPNAFILYRKERHPILKSEHPDYHNNDISVILGKKWKSEPDGVKAYYKKLAEEIKAQHKQNYPDYQYTPRKSSEKSRRMAPRRASEIARAQRTPSTELQSEENVPGLLSSASADVSELLGISRPKHLQQFVEDEDGNVDFTLPTHNTTKLHAMIHRHRSNLSAASQPFDPSNERQLSSSIPLYVQNDQDFVDSLVDWDGIAADTALVRDASAEEMAQLGGIEVGDGYLALSDEDQRALFEAELERTMRYFG